MDLLAHLAIVYFEEIDDGKSFEPKLPIDARLKKVVTNKTVVDVFNDNSDWVMRTKVLLGAFNQ